MNNVVAPALKQPYTKPTLTKHKPLRDITAGDVSVVRGG
jgi:hypothetical protein